MRALREDAVAADAADEAARAEWPATGAALRKKKPRTPLSRAGAKDRPTGEEGQNGLRCHLELSGGGSSTAARSSLSLHQHPTGGDQS